MSSLNFTLIQTSLHWEDKEANLQLLENKINSIQENTQVVILPEMFSTGFSMKPEEFAENMHGKTLHWVKRMASEKKVIVTGSLMIEEGGKYYNRLVWMLPNGQYGQYDKRHLFAYAEEDKHYTAGSQRLIASVNGWKINLMVCYDLRFPVWSRQTSPPLPLQQSQRVEQASLEYDVLIYVANWPERRSIAWKTLLVARAIENQSYVIGVNRVGMDGNDINHSGNSMVVDPLGEILYHKADDEDVFTITLEKEHLEKIREKLPFWRDADRFLLMNDKDDL
ncbi:MAG TPA: nitrilase family protein [Chitinophagaceae bacterium]|nr:nitrilase family protein [Chitinophagaceae bacterium]